MSTSGELLSDDSNLDLLTKYISGGGLPVGSLVLIGMLQYNDLQYRD